MTTFKEVDAVTPIKKQIKKVGLSLGIVFSKDDLKRFNLQFNDEIDLSDAKIIKTKNT
jgi:hypothetical protein